MTSIAAAIVEATGDDRDYWNLIESDFPYPAFPTDYNQDETEY